MTSVCNLWCFLRGSACWTRLLAGRSMDFILHRVFLESISEPQDKTNILPCLPLGYFQSPGSPGGIWAGDDNPIAPLPSHTALILQLNCFRQPMEQFRDWFLKDQRDRSVTMSKNPKYEIFFSEWHLVFHREELEILLKIRVILAKIIARG